MSSTRPNLTRPPLTQDEQSFQGLLSAAFTIQEHNERRKQAREAIVEESATPPEAVKREAHPEMRLEAQPDAHPETRGEEDIPKICPHCGARKLKEASRCESCGLEELRPGERLQRNWASMWLMSQEQGLWPERPSKSGNGIRKIGEAIQPDFPAGPAKWTSGEQTEHALTASNSLAWPVKKKDPDTSVSESFESGQGQIRDKFPFGQFGFGDPTEADKRNVDATEIEPIEPQAFEKVESEGADLYVQPIELSADAESYAPEMTADRTESASAAHSGSPPWRWADLQVTLRFHRADLYLGLAVFVALIALMWPAASATKPAALGPWERALIGLGIAEAPAAVIHPQGDPSVQVWVDPHTALYYCPGSEAYGKTPNGRFSSQGEAQLDRFEPAERSVCE